MVTWAVPCFSCEGLLTPQLWHRGPACFFLSVPTQPKGFAVFAPGIPGRPPSPWLAAQVKGATVTSTCGDVQFVLLSMACVSSNCPSENATRKSSVARGGRGEKWVTSTGHREASFAET